MTSHIIQKPRINTRTLCFRFYVTGLTDDVAWSEDTRYPADESPISGKVRATYKKSCFRHDLAKTKEEEEPHFLLARNTMQSLSEF